MKDNKDTLKILYWIVAVLGVISIIMEFDVIEYIIDLIIMDIENLESFSFIVSIKAHLQLHGAFYENIALGGLASAFISIIAIKVIVNNYKKDYFFKCDSSARKLAALFELAILEIKYFKDLQDLDELERNNNIFGEQINDYIKTIDINQEEDNPMWKEMLVLCNKTFIPVQDDIKVFLSCIKESSWFQKSADSLGWSEMFHKGIWNKCVSDFLDKIDKKYSIFETIQKLYKIKMLSKNEFIYFDQVLESIKKMEVEGRNISKHTEYMISINDAFTEGNRQWIKIETEEIEKMKKEAAAKRDSKEAKSDGDTTKSDASKKDTKDS